MKQELGKRKQSAMETRRRLLTAARKLLCNQDFSEISVADIAKAAGVAVGSFYVYFRRKEEIVEALKGHDFYRLAEIVNGMAEKGVLERFSYYCREFMKGIEECGLEITRQWIRNNVVPRRMRHGDEDVTKYSFDVRAVRSILEECVRFGMLAPETPVDELAVLVNAELYGLMLAWCMSDGAVVASTRTEGFVEKVLARMLEPYLIQ